MAEVSRAFNKAVASERLWMNLITNAVSCKTHRYPEIPLEGIPERSWLNRTNLKEAFLPRAKDTPAMCRDIMGTGATPEWTTMAAHKLPLLQEDQCLLLSCAEHGNWECAETVWHSMLFLTDNLLVRNKRQSVSKWFYSMGSVGGTAVMLWPCREEVHNNRKLFALADEDPVWMPIKSYKDWEAMAVEWRSVKWLKHAMKATNPVCNLVLKNKSSPKDLLHLAATRAMWNLKKLQLFQVMRYEKMPFSRTDPMHALLTALFKRFEPTATEIDVAEMLSHRLTHDTELAANLRSEHALDTFMAEDKDDVEQVGAKNDAKKAQETEIRDAIRVIRKRVAETSAKPAKRAKSTGKTSTATIAEGTRQYPAAVNAPSGGWTAQSLAEYLLADFRVYEDHLNMRWLLTHRNHSRSWSWNKWSWQGGAVALLRTAWEIYADRGGEGPPFEMPPASLV
eukprot:6478311-Amphidinium_carterae.2